MVSVKIYIPVNLLVLFIRNIKVYNYQCILDLK